MSLEGVFIAANVAEVDFVEKLLDEAGVEYEVRPEAFMRTMEGVCYQGLLFEVRSGQADFCRRLIRDCGLGRGIV